MPGRDGTGPYGTFIDCTDPATGLQRPLYIYRFGGYLPPAPPSETPLTYSPTRTQTNPSYGYAPWDSPYRGYNNPGYGSPSYGYTRFGFGYTVYGYGPGRRRRRGWDGRGKGRW